MHGVTAARPTLDDVYLRFTGRRFADADQPGTGQPTAASPPRRQPDRRITMTTIAAHTTWMTQRQLKAIAAAARLPGHHWLIQPVIWLFLFGSLFRKVAELPGFGAPSYLDYLVPGVVVMSALSSSMWSGMAVLEEIDRGIMDRFLVLPLHRSAIINASVVMQSHHHRAAVADHRGARPGARAPTTPAASSG